MSLKSKMRTHLSAALLTPMLFVGATACTSSESEVPGGDFYVLNANPAVTSVQLNIDEGGPVFTSGVAFGAFCCTPAVRVPESEDLRQIRLTAGTSSTVLAAADLRVVRDSIYFLVLMRSATDSTLSDMLTFKNNAEWPEPDKAKLRFVHTAAAIPGADPVDVGPVDIYITEEGADLATAEPVYANLQYGQVLNHVVITPPSEKLVLRITAAGDRVSTPLLTKTYRTVQDANSTLEYLGPGSFGTLFLINSGTAPFKLPIRLFQVGGI